MKTSLWVIIVGSLFIFSFGVAAQKDPAPPKRTPEMMSQAKKNFEQICAPCHGTKGDGKGPAGAALKPPPNDFTKPLKEWSTTKGDPQKIFDVISKGIPGTGMVAWLQFSEQERWGLVYTVREFAASSKTPAKKK